MKQEEEQEEERRHPTTNVKKRRERGPITYIDGMTGLRIHLHPRSEPISQTTVSKSQRPVNLQNTLQQDAGVQSRSHGDTDTGVLSGSHGDTDTGALSGSCRKVKNMRLQVFRQKLIDNFEIAYERNEIIWPGTRNRVTQQIL